MGKVMLIGIIAATTTVILQNNLVAGTCSNPTVDSGCGAACEGDPQGPTCNDGVNGDPASCSCCPTRVDTDFCTEANDGSGCNCIIGAEDAYICNSASGEGFCGCFCHKDGRLVLKSNSTNSTNSL